jgi:integrase
MHYEQLSREYILPHLGKIKLRELRPENIQGLYNWLLEQGIGTYTVLKAHAVLQSALSHAVKIGVIGHNPASVTIPPKKPAEEMTILDEGQVSQLLIAAHGSQLEALLHLALATGMREMELLGLKWVDLDWVKQTLKVERQLVRPEEGKVKFAPPKTRSGKRSLALGPETITALRKHYKHQHAERKAAGEKWQDHDLIFANRLGGPIHPRNLLRDFKQLLQYAELPEIRFHDLRHTAASLMLNDGTPPIVVSKRLGHAKASITLDVYGHLIPDMDAKAAEGIDRLLVPGVFPQQILESSVLDLQTIERGS